MTNELGLAAVTALLKDLLHSRLIAANIGDVTVSVRSPDHVKTDNGEPTQLNLFLYRVSENQGWRNVGLPSLDDGGQEPLSNPPLALDLYYLLTAYGDDEFRTEILLGYAMQALHDTPVLTRKTIRDKFAAGALPPPLDTIVPAELAEQVELIKITPQLISTEEISRLWTAFGAHYRPTAAYQASVVLIEGDRSTRAPLPVRERLIKAVPFREPHVDGVAALAGASAPILAEGTILIRGRRLAAEGLEVRVGGLDATVLQSAEERVVAKLPPGLRAGVQSVQVVLPVALGPLTPPRPHRGFESNLAAFVLRPAFGGLTLAPATAGAGPYTGTATVIVTPHPDARQRVSLVLDRDSASYTFRAETRAADADPVLVPLERVERGDYFVRVRVDGADSPLDLDPASPGFGPKVTI